MILSAGEVIVRNTRPEDFPAIIELTRETYPQSPPWSVEQLTSHQKRFPEGQFIAADAATGVVVGMAASLIVMWDEYDTNTAWRHFTHYGTFNNHDPGRGRTLYAAEIMVHPTCQERGIGGKIYQARRRLTRRLGLLRIRAGARLRGYSRHAERMSAEDYVIRVIRRELHDPTLSFQLNQGFRVLAVTPEYLIHDDESLGYAAVIEWLNPNIGGVQERAAEQDPRFDPVALMPDANRARAPERRY